MKTLANFEDNHKIPSYSSLDVLLDGGFEKGCVTQIYGSPSSGKSNVALALAVSVARKNRKVIYIDTEGGISIGSSRFQVLTFRMWPITSWFWNLLIFYSKAKT